MTARSDGPADHPGGGMPSTVGTITNRPPADSTSCAADYLFRSIVAPFTRMGGYRRDQFQGGVFVEDRHGVDDLEAHPGPGTPRPAGLIGRLGPFNRRYWRRS